jgi:hypothetical protein
MKRNRSHKRKDDTTRHEQWILFWDYELPRMERKYLNQKNSKTNRLPHLPKDPFELATYKICELKFYTDVFYPHIPSLEERAKIGQH